VGLGISRKGRGSVGWEILGRRGDGGSCLVDISLSDDFELPFENHRVVGPRRKAPKTDGEPARDDGRGVDWDDDGFDKSNVDGEVNCRRFMANGAGPPDRGVSSVQRWEINHMRRGWTR
jgi:hypothetical protein